MRHDDAEDLWHRFGTGDGSAFAQLYEDHHRDVFRYCRSLLHHEEDAHDAAQGTWTAIWTTPGAARREIPLRPWLFRVAHNEAIDILRRRRAHVTLTDLEVPALDDVASDVELRDRLLTLRADLVSLPERQRAALLLREVAGLGHAEIGQVFGISAAAAKQTIYEARRGLLEAEDGRTMACELVRRAISDGDGRVRRGRRLRAHLRGCASCRAFADGLGRRRRDLHLLFPAPAALGLLARAAAGVGGGAGGAATGGVVVAGGSVAAKLAVAAAVLAVAGVGGQHELAHAGDSGAKGANAPARAAAAATAAATPRAAPAAVPRRAAPVAPTRTAARPQRVTRRRSAITRGETVAHRDSASAAPTTTPAPATAPAPVAAQPAAASPGHSATAPGQVKKAAAAAPPGQAKKVDAAAEPPGQAKKVDPAAVPPGQAKKVDPATVPPGQAKKAEGTGDAPAPAEPGPAAEGSAGVPPGQAKADTPPGQAKK